MEFPKCFVPKKKDKDYVESLLKKPKPEPLEELEVEGPKSKPGLAGPKKQVVVDFSILLNDGKYRTERAAQRDGAKIFKKKFCGFWGTKQRSERETLEFIVELGLATDENSARDVIAYLKDGHIAYTKYDRFVLREVKNTSGDKAYKLKCY